MEETATQNPKMKLALQIVHTAQSELGCPVYRRYAHNDLVLNSLIQDFKHKYVFNGKEYQRARNQYIQGAITLDCFKRDAEQTFKNELKSCNRPAIDNFFGIIKIGKVNTNGRQKSKKRRVRGIRCNKEHRAIQV